jgi:hypothetical protein
MSKSKLNFGVLKNKVSNLLGEAYVNDSNLNEAKNVFTDFNNTISNSPILTLQYIIYKNLENKTIKEENSAIRYIDENIVLINQYDKKDIINEIEKLKKFDFDKEIDTNKKSLFEAIQTMLLEASKGTRSTNVDKLHESFEFVLQHITSDKKEHITESSPKMIESNPFFTYKTVIKSAITKFNDKYSHLSEDERRILNILLENDSTKKRELFDNLKTETIKILEEKSTDEDDEEKEKITKVTTIIEAMNYEELSLVNSIVELNNLKNSFC